MIALLPFFLFPEFIAAQKLGKLLKFVHCHSLTKILPRKIRCILGKANIYLIFSDFLYLTPIKSCKKLLIKRMKLVRLYRKLV